MMTDRPTPRYRHSIPQPQLDRNRIVHALAALEAINDRSVWSRLAEVRRLLELELER